MEVGGRVNEECKGCVLKSLEFSLHNTLMHNTDLRY